MTTAARLDHHQESPAAFRLAVAFLPGTRVAFQVPDLEGRTAATMRPLVITRDGRTAATIYTPTAHVGPWDALEEVFLDAFEFPDNPRQLYHPHDTPAALMAAIYGPAWVEAASADLQEVSHRAWKERSRARTKKFF